MPICEPLAPEMCALGIDRMRGFGVCVNGLWQIVGIVRLVVPLVDRGCRFVGYAPCYRDAIG